MRFAPTAFDALIDKYATLHHVEAAIVRAIMATESAFNPNARSPVGAIGLMQLMPTTARELGVNPFNPEENIEGGVRYSLSCCGCSAGSSWPWSRITAGPASRSDTRAGRQRSTAKRATT